MIQRRRYLPTIASVTLLTLALLSIACPSSNDLDRMAKASNELAHDVVIANQVVGDVYTARRAALTAKAEKATTPEEKAAIASQLQSLLAAKDRIADKLGTIGDKGEKFNNLLIELDKKYPQGTPPPADLTFVRQNLSELRSLYSEVLADLLPFKAQKAVSDLDKHLSTIEKVVK